MLDMTCILHGSDGQSVMWISRRSKFESVFTPDFHSAWPPEFSHFFFWENSLPFFFSTWLKWIPFPCRNVNGWRTYINGRLVVFSSSNRCSKKTSNILAERERKSTDGSFVCLNKNRLWAVGLVKALKRLESERWQRESMVMMLMGGPY